MLVPSLTTAPAFGTVTTSVKLPRKATSIESTLLYWNALAPTDGVDMWTQNGPTSTGPTNPGSLKLLSFTLPAGGIKTEQRNVETFCLPVPQGHDHIHLRLRNASATGHTITALTAFKY